MQRLLMISGDRALAEGKRGAFYNTLEEFHTYWERIDIICPPLTTSHKLQATSLFGNVFIHPSPWPLLFQPFWIIKKGTELIHAHKHHLMTVHEYPPFYNGIGARVLAKRTSIPYVLEMMHIPGHPRAANAKERLYKLLIRWFIRFDAAEAAAVRVINQRETPEFLKRAGIPAEKLKYIPAFYIDLTIFRPREVSKEYDLIFVGRLEENKGAELFVRAAALLNATALVVGAGSREKKLRALSHQLQARVAFRGWAKDAHEIAELMNRSRVLVMPSYSEGGPRVVLEAMACGVPVLATPVGIVPELMKDALSGGLIDWDADDIAQKAELLLRDLPTHEKYRLAGLERAKRFERSAAIKQYADAVKRIL